MKFNNYSQIDLGFHNCLLTLMFIYLLWKSEHGTRIIFILN